MPKSPHPVRRNDPVLDSEDASLLIFAMAAVMCGIFTDGAKPQKSKQGRELATSLISLGDALHKAGGVRK